MIPQTAAPGTNPGTRSDSPALIPRASHVGHTPPPWVALRVHPDPDTAARLVQIYGTNVTPNVSNDIAVIYTAGVGTESAANADFICLAVNAHDDLVAAAQRIVSEYRAFGLTIGAIEDAEEALAKAGAA